MSLDAQPVRRSADGAYVLSFIFVPLGRARWVAVCGLLGVACSSSLLRHTSDGGDRPDARGSTESVEIIVEPGDDGDALYDSMSRATKSIHMTMYLFTSERFIALLLSKKGAGVDVKVVLNETFPAESATNTASYRKLQSGGVPVVWAPSAFTYTHEKCVIVDATVAWIMTMNLDDTSAKKNREYLAIDTKASDVAEAEALFLADYSHSLAAVSGDLLIAPANARQRLLDLIGSATHTLDVEDEEFSDDEIVDAIAAAGKKGILARVVLSTDPASSAEASAVGRVQVAGAKVVRTAMPYIHAKAVVVDGNRAFIGSENLTTASLEYNRELGLITSQASEVAKVEAAIGADYTRGTPE
jgi:cardiolipin synthase